jgi:inorganic triphosphatase YgiF
MADEIELKLALAEADHARFLRHPLLRQAVARQALQLDNIYYDTESLTLRRRGVALRLRRKGRLWLQTVKLAGNAAAGLSSRPEWESPYAGHFDFSAIEDEELRVWLQRPKLLARIVPVCETRFRRNSWTFPAEGGTVLLTLDRGWVIGGGRREVISELELELAGAPVPALFTLAGQLAARVPLVPAVLSKAERGYRLHAGMAPAPVKAAPIALAADSTPFAAFCRIALACLEHLQQNHPGALHSENVEYIHQMRVATRRLRAALRLFAPALPPGLREELRAPLSALMRQLGTARDLDVLQAEIVDPVLRALPEEPRLSALASAITNRRYAARREVLAALATPAHGSLLLNTMSALHPTLPPPGEAPLADFAAHRLRRLARRVRRLALTVNADDPPALHALRIAVKRLRYGLEFFATVRGLSRLRHMQANLAATQDVLGKLNDLANAGVLLTDCTGHDAQLREAVALVGGWHGPRYTALLGEVTALLPKLARLRLPAAPEA